MLTQSGDLPKITSQRQIDLEASWWKERFKIYTYVHNQWTVNWDSFYTTLDGYWWHHHQILLGPLVIEFTIRKGKSC